MKQELLKKFEEVFGDSKGSWRLFRTRPCEPDR